MCTELTMRNDEGVIIMTDYQDCYNPACPYSEEPGPTNESDR